MAKQEKVLINLRIPKNILLKFDKMIDEDDLSPSRVAKVISLMHESVERYNKNKNKGK